MKNQLAHAKRQAAKAAAPTAGSDKDATTVEGASGAGKRGRGKGSKGGRGKKQKTEPAAETENAAVVAEDEQQDADVQEAAVADDAAADECTTAVDDKVMADAAADGEESDQERATAGEQADTRLESDKCANGAGSGGAAAKKAASSQKKAQKGKVTLGTAVAEAAPAQGDSEKAAASSAAAVAGKKRRQAAAAGGECQDLPCVSMVSYMPQQAAGVLDSGASRQLKSTQSNVVSSEGLRVLPCSIFVHH